MRIIAGKYRGRKLVDFQADNIRPTTDRVKETLFNKLMHVTEGARVLDLFSGTGNLALECLSREAAWVDLVESHAKSLGIIKENFQLLKVTEGFRIHCLDVFRYIDGYRKDLYDLVIADPPFTEALAHRLATVIGASTNLLKPGAVLVIEAGSKERMDQDYPGLIRLDRREFGDKHLNFFEKANYDQGDISR
ncbi:MAG TPA: 16S rRNA (guanine(966)-N(2))-methyltransferase RsmD [Bdellovibrionales bacterium]|nr:16S rRNA (guanine(966)-N(2))-methyltransferase RsmD [Bdellovibrionales bacterium]